MTTYLLDTNIVSPIELRVLREAAGKPLALFDLLIAAHAKALYATLVTRDASFGLLSCGIALEDWTSTP